MLTRTVFLPSLPFKQHEEDILLGAEVLHRGRPSANLTPEDVVEDLSHIFLTLVRRDTYEGFRKQRFMNIKLIGWNQP